MKIRSQVWLLLLAALPLMPLGFGVSLHAARQAERESHQIAATEDLISGVLQLHQTAVETVLFQEARGPDEWRRKVASIQAELARLPTDEAFERASLDRIKKNISLADAIYPRLTPGKVSGGTDVAAVDAALAARTISSLFMLTQEVLDTAFDLQRFHREEMAQEQRLLQWSLVLAVVSALGLAAFVARLVFVGILRPLRRLEDGAKHIADGDYSHRMHLQPRNEIGMLGATFDLMAERVQQARQALLEEAENSRRAEQLKSEFVSTVSHELRTPLTSISGALRLATAGALGEMPPKMRGMMEVAHRNGLRLAHLINDLLDMEKLMAGKIDFDFDLHPLMPLVEQALEANRGYAEQFQVRYALEGRADGATLRIDPKRLQQVLANFLSNAAKFSPVGAEVRINASTQGGRVRVSVADDGSGIPEQFRPRVFQKFAQADSTDTRQKGGTGLGLAISKDLVERMGGGIGFDSEPGCGACFWFEFPLPTIAQEDSQGVSA